GIARMKSTLPAPFAGTFGGRRRRPAFTRSKSRKILEARCALIRAGKPFGVRKIPPMRLLIWFISFAGNREHRQFYGHARIGPIFVYPALVGIELPTMEFGHIRRRRSSQYLFVTSPLRTTVLRMQAQFSLMPFFVCTKTRYGMSPRN